MLRENEIITAALAVASLFVLRAPFVRFGIRKIPFHRVLLVSIYCLLFSSLFTIIEGFFEENLFNLLEHAGYCLSSLLFMAWAWLSTRRRGSPQ
jgi:hypothetical protein